MWFGESCEEMELVYVLAETKFYKLTNSRGRIGLSVILLPYLKKIQNAIFKV